MIPWNTVTEWGSRLAIVTGLATPVYGGLAYLKLTPVTELYVSEQVNAVRREVTLGRAETLDTKRAVLGLARNDLVRERDALTNALKTEANPTDRQTFVGRLESINTEIERIDRSVARLEEKIEEIKSR